jgi:sulfatase maturation enzyme AslB (radical SAM superfamily)
VQQDLPKSFCILPWVHRFTNIGGEIQVCCTSEEFDNNILDNFGNRFSASNNPTDEEIFNSNYMKDIRLKMLRGESPQICHRCVQTEKHGSVSRRIAENKHFQDLIQRAVEATGEDGTIEVSVRSADMRLGNLCNLACRMCTPRSSSKWMSDWKRLGRPSFIMDRTMEDKLGDTQWYKTEAFIKQFSQSLAGLRHLHFAGGEPLLNPEMKNFLKACIDQDVAQQIELTYNTNLTVLPEEVTRLWKHFQGVKLLCSIDGYGELNNYIRRHSKWEVIASNLMQLENHFEDYNLTSVHIMCTVQAYNIGHLEDLYNFLAGFQKVDFIPHLSDLYIPEYLRTQILPKTEKQAIRKKLTDLYKKKFTELEHRSGQIKSDLKSALDSIQGSIEFMDSIDLNSKSVFFVRRSLALDKLDNPKKVGESSL